jgi:hypothetical protein
MQIIRGDKPTEGITHIYMEIPQENSCISSKQKCHIFLFMFSFSLLKNWITGGQNRSCPGERDGTFVRGDVGEKG